MSHFPSFIFYRKTIDFAGAHLARGRRVLQTVCTLRLATKCGAHYKIHLNTTTSRMEPPLWLIKTVKSHKCGKAACNKLLWPSIARNSKLHSNIKLNASPMRIVKKNGRLRIQQINQFSAKWTWTQWDANGQKMPVLILRKSAFKMWVHRVDTLSKTLNHKFAPFNFPVKRCLLGSGSSQNQSWLISSNCYGNYFQTCTHDQTWAPCK